MGMVGSGRWGVLQDAYQDYAANLESCLIAYALVWCTVGMHLR